MSVLQTVLELYCRVLVHYPMWETGKEATESWASQARHYLNRAWYSGLITHGEAMEASAGIRRWLCHVSDNPLMGH